MIKDGGLSFEFQLNIDFLPPNNGSKKCLEKSNIYYIYICMTTATQNNHKLEQ